MSRTAAKWMPVAECCIFHARRQFGDWSDDSDEECTCDVSHEEDEEGPAGEPGERPEGPAHRESGKSK
jgi:Protein phosphatase inhibitor